MNSYCLEYVFAFSFLYIIFVALRCFYEEFVCLLTDEIIVK